MMPETSVTTFDHMGRAFFRGTAPVMAPVDLRSLSSIPTGPSSSAPVLQQQALLSAVTARQAQQGRPVLPLPKARSPLNLLMRA